MSRAPVDVVSVRLKRARAQLDDRLASPCAWSEIEPLLKEIESLEGLAQKRRRKRSLTWLIGVGVGVLSIALLLHLIRVGEAQISFAGSTRALIVHSGASTMNVLAESLPVQDVRFSMLPDETCFSSITPMPRQCEPNELIRLNTLVFNANSTVAIRISDDCVEVEPFDGGASASITRLQKDDPSVPTPVASRWRSAQAVLEPGKSLRFCPDASGIVQMSGLVALVTADRAFGGASTREEMPALLNGTLAIEGTESSAALRQTDLLHVRGLTHATLMAHLGRNIELNLVGRANEINLSNGLESEERSMMPTVLERMFYSTGLRWAIAIIGAIAGPLLAIRERLLAEGVEA